MELARINKLDNHMKRIKNIIFLLLIAEIGFAQDVCDKYQNNYIPINLTEAIECLNCEWSDSLKIKFKNSPKSDLVFYGGMGLRNAWELWPGRNKLSKYFKKLGIYHPDDMSSIIIESFHRQLNGEPILLDQQIKMYLEYWKEVKRKDRIILDSLNLIFGKKFKSLSKGDTVQIQFNIYEEEGRRIQQYPLYKDDCNCLVEGILKSKTVRKKKYFRGKYELHVKVISICGLNEILFRMEDTELKVNKTYKFFNLDDYRVSKK